MLLLLTLDWLGGWPRLETFKLTDEMRLEMTADMFDRVN